MNKLLSLSSSFLASCAITLLVLTLVATGVNAASVTVSVDPASIIDTNLTAGKSFFVNITVSGVTDLYGWEFKLNYNTSILTADNITEGPFLNTGNLLWVSSDDDNIYRVEPTEPTTTIGSWTKTDQPYGLTYLNGFIYYSDPGTNSIYKLNGTSGATITSWDISAFSGDPFGLGNNGTHFAIADRGDRKVYITAVGAPATLLDTFTWTGIDRPEGVTWGAGYWWVIDIADDTVEKISTTGSLITAYSIVGFSGDGTGIAYDGTNFWITDEGDEKIYKTDTSFTKIAEYSPPANDPQGIDFGLGPRPTQTQISQINDAYTATTGRVYASVTLQGDIHGVNGSGTLATIGFSVDALGESNLDLYDTKLVGYNFAAKSVYPIAHTAVDGYFKNLVIVPEFPLGVAAEIALATVIVYLWFKRGHKGKETQPSRFPGQ